MSQDIIKVLLVIENKIQAEFLEMILEENNNYKVEKEFNGKVVFEKLKNNPEDYLDSVIIISYQLPEMDGLKIMSELKKLGYNYAFIFLTSDKTVERALEAMKSGALDFIPKSEELPEMLPEMVEKVYFIQKDKLEQDRIKKELDESRRALEKLSVVARETNNGVLIYDNNGVIEWMNEGYTKLTGYNLSEYIKKYGDNIILNDHDDELKNQIWSKIEKNKPYSYTVKAKTLDEKDIWLQISLSPAFDENGNLSKIVKVVSDITEIKLKEAEIVKQKENIEHSINYAKRIQEALFPEPDTIMKGVISDLLVFLKPKDIVSGDFYWFNQTGDKILIAAADCTGHGVPGSFMSMLGISSLNVIVRQLDMKSKEESNEENKMDYIKSNIMLDMLKAEIIRSLRQTGESGEAQDGMDIALSIIDLQSNKLQFSGAYNPMLLIRNNELTEYKADKMPIGIHRKKTNPFSAEEIEIENNDVIYMFSDGFIDQFGGEDGSKFMLKNFKTLLLQIYEKPMSEQYSILDDAIKNWRGERPQIDDILVIGVKFKTENIIE